MSGMTISGTEDINAMVQSLSTGHQRIVKVVSDFAEGNVSDALDKVAQKYNADPQTQVEPQIRRTSATRVKVQVRIRTERGPYMIKRITADVKRAMDRAAEDTVTEIKRYGLAKGRVM